MLVPFDHTCLLLLSLSHGWFCVQMLRILHCATDIMGVKHKMFPDADVRKTLVWPGVRLKYASKMMQESRKWWRVFRVATALYLLHRSSSAIPSIGFLDFFFFPLDLN